MIMERAARRQILIPLSLLLITTCAEPPGDIAAADMPVTPYPGNISTELTAIVSKDSRKLVLDILLRASGA